MSGPRHEAVVVGASAGAVDALSALLPGLSPDYPLPIMVVVHVPPEKTSLLVDLFRAKCRVQVREADDKELIKGSTIYFAPPDYHLLVETDGRMSLSSEEPVSYSRPSIDVLFESTRKRTGRGSSASSSQVQTAMGRRDYVQSVMRGALPWSRTPISPKRGTCRRQHSSAAPKRRP